MNDLILACQFLPLLGFISIMLFGNSEKTIANLSFLTTHAMGASITALLSLWTLQGFPNHEFVWFTLYQQVDLEFPIVFYFDKIGAAYLFCIWVIFAVIIRYCRYYMHREAGYKRFFLTIFAFAFGLNMVVLSGVLDMFFAGWEIVGISSFLLIAFYRHRVQPVRNAIRAYTVYRFCDIGLLLGAWLSDHILHGDNHFSELARIFATHEHPPGGHLALYSLSLLLIIAASGKSAQFPFCFWLPRAMEGPTPSSAIFYGALSVHLGVFLLLRTHPIWGAELLTCFIVFAIGLATIVVASISEKTQSNIKGQIAYASITQVGLMFMELALGLESLVIVHFLGNAFFRCYQLLVSPSIVAHLLRIEGALETGFDIRGKSFAQSMPVSIRESLPEVLQNTLYVFSLQEFNLEALVRGLLWQPLMNAGAALERIPTKRKLTALAAVLVLNWLGLEAGAIAPRYLVLLAASGMAICSLLAFSQKQDVFKVWNYGGLSSVLAAYATWLSSHNAAHDVGLFLTGIIPAWLVGILVLKRMLRDERIAQTPFAYRAMAERKPTLAFLLFVSFLGFVSFPITPAFIGEDLLLYHVSSHDLWIVPLIAFSFVLNGIAAAKVFVRLSMGRPVEIRHTPSAAELKSATAEYLSEAKVSQMSLSR